MRKISLQWRLTVLTTVIITVLCGCLTFLLYKNGVYGLMSIFWTQKVKLFYAALLANNSH